MRKNVYKIRLIIACIVFLLCTFAFFGFYFLPVINLEYVPFLQRVLRDFSIISLVFLVTLLFITFVFGRIYCSVICPLGIGQEILALIYSKFKKKNSTAPIFRYKYLLMALFFGAMLGGSSYLIKYIEPYSIFGSFLSLRLYGVVICFIIIVLVFYKNRFFCSNVCPVGAFLGLISKASLFKNYISDDCVSCGTCFRNCPTGCINLKEKKIKDSSCVKCLRCVSACPKGAMKYGIKPEKEVKFDINKRTALFALGITSVFAGAWIMGVKFSQNVIRKFKNVVLPAGAKDMDRMINNCLNCDLCVQNCPNGILTKANKDFPCVHIDYLKGLKYCGYNCSRCLEVCPSAAILKMDIKEKQNTKIASAKINENCIGCKSCIEKCPKGAIEVVDDVVKINDNKCIGCNRCASVCPANAIEIKGVEEQKLI